jgi:hypothetical protein
MTQRKTLELYLIKQRNNDFRDDAIQSLTAEVEIAVVIARATSDIIHPLELRHVISCRHGNDTMITVCAEHILNAPLLHWTGSLFVCRKGRPPLWSSGQRSGFDSRRYQIF